MEGNKTEPLKNKMMVVLGTSILPEFKFFFADSVKSAVQGLLQEIDEEISNWQKAENKGKVNKAYARGYISSLTRMKDLIRKWFADVF